MALGKSGACRRADEIRMLSRYVLASIGLIIAFLLAAFVIGWFSRP
jgi:hypothetical protein